MVNKKISLILVVVFSLFFLSSCSQEDCSLKDSTYTKFGFDKGLGECVVIKEIPKDKCGNEIAEDNENFCNCPKDVSKTHPTKGCTGEKGDFLSMSCNEKTKTCGLYENEKVVSESKVLLFKNSDVQIQVELDLNNPFVLNSDDNSKAEVLVSLFNLPSQTNVINELIVENFAIDNTKNTRLLDYDFNGKLMNIGEELKLVKVPFKDTTKYESKESLKAKLTISYQRDIYSSSGDFVRSENKKETLTAPIGYWTFINPNFLD